ncbi:MAG: isoprenylcysteine carboxylmethyltransferase family protein [Anaerolineae bacterium]
MFTGIVQAAVILAVIVIFYVVDSLLIRHYDRLRAYGSSRNWGYTAIAVTAALFLTVQPVVLPGLGVYTREWWGLAVQIGGLVLIAGALALYWWGRLHLGQFYGERVEIQPGQYLITDGPYAYIRHPLYTAYFALAIGLALINPSLPMLLVVIYAFVDFSQATRREEKLLVERLPGYAEYMARTPRYLPRLGRKTNPAAP